jgi:uncharacterized protein (DUF1499 family)
MPPRPLPPCPSSPNCVSTLASHADTQHAIAPFRYQKSLVEAKELLKALIASLPRTRFTSLLIRFVDDVEFVFDEGSKTIHFRSASRVGYGDLGVNRRRMENIRSSLSGRI